jgi:hypothetical protein
MLAASKQGNFRVTDENRAVLCGSAEFSGGGFLSGKHSPRCGKHCGNRLPVFSSGAHFSSFA